MENDSKKSESAGAIISIRLLVQSDLKGRPSEIIRKLAGRILPASNGWGNGEVVGAWKLRKQGEDEAHVRLLIACPNANNPVQLFNEDARDYCANTKLRHGAQND